MHFVLLTSVFVSDRPLDPFPGESLVFLEKGQAEFAARQKNSSSTNRCLSRLMWKWILGAFVVKGDVMEKRQGD